MTKQELLELKPCLASYKFIKKYETVEEMWLNCERSDWMFWLIFKKDKTKFTATNYTSFYNKLKERHSTRFVISNSPSLLLNNNALFASNDADCAAYCCSSEKEEINERKQQAIDLREILGPNFISSL